ncbi:hypothetical protein COV16_07090 [Candidatus Woesearchaeota archaeon CG10_big_fil_rev_8_21_14_0_10_34_8]|nr:MAG: hypothetical protein COV16_07090 [Candidatus Woesearchaeota archaeon CG10_big_fil_rev_8_21_14_0_10_34_8]
MDVRNVLENSGLAGNEVNVYLTLLDLGSALAGDITKHSGVNRTNVYDALERLIEKGLVTYVIESNRKCFEAADPRRIIYYIEEQKSELEKKKNNIANILNELDGRRKLNSSPQEATIYKGKKGLKNVLEEVLRLKKEMLLYGTEGKLRNLVGEYYAEKWHLLRKKMKIHMRVITNERRRGEKISTPDREYKFQRHLYEIPATTWIFGDKVAITVWSDQPITTLIRSKEVANSYRAFFEILWKAAKP